MIASEEFTIEFDGGARVIHNRKPERVLLYLPMQLGILIDVLG